MYELYIVSGFSGAGKGTLLDKLKDRNDLYFSISETTRAQRNDIDKYRFISDSEFEKKAVSGYYLEYCSYGTGKGYGTPKSPIEEAFYNNKNVVLEIDVNGYQQVNKYNFSDNVVIKSLFVVADSETLYQRLLKRDGNDGCLPTRDIYKRLKIAYEEAESISQYDCILNNSGMLQESIAKIESFFNGGYVKDKFNVSEFKSRILKIMEEIEREQ